MADDSDLEKTEAPTPQKEEKAREEGQIPRSRELTSVLMMVAGLAILWIGGDAMAGRLARIVSQSLNFDYATIGDDTQMLRHVGSLLRQAASALIPIMFGAVLVALSAPLLLGGVLFSTKSLKVNFKN